MATLPDSSTSLPHTGSQSSSVNSDSLKSPSPSDQNNREMRESSDTATMPSLCHGKGIVSADPGYNHFTSRLIRTPTPNGFAPWTSCPDDQRPAALNPATYDYKGNQNLADVTSESSYEGPGYIKSMQHGPWLQRFNSSPAQLPAHSTFAVDQLFPPDHYTVQMTSPRRSYPPLPAGPRSRQTWDDFGVTNTPNGIFAPRPRHFHHFAFDTPDSSESSLHLTANDSQAGVLFAPQHTYQDFDDDMSVGSVESDADGSRGEPPYAKLIYNALMDAPGHKLVLREIYTWISKNTEKAKDPAFKGWQNSVRHNLSMNGAFVKVAYTDPENKHKKGYIWVLDPAAVGKGVESTTRYRQKTHGKRSNNSHLLDPKRQRSGRKGGRAARKSTKLRRSAKAENHVPVYEHYLRGQTSQYSHSSPGSYRDSQSPTMNQYDMGGLPYYLGPTSSESPQPDSSPYSYSGDSVHPDIPTDPNLFNTSFGTDSGFLGDGSDELFGAQDMTTFV